MSFIPYARQTIDQDDIDAVVRILKSDYLTTGPAVPTFEGALCKATGARYAVAVSNGTAALHAACFAANIKPGDEVITTPITFAASANCALYMGARPVFADIDPETYNIDPERVEALITPKTRAIIPVHYTGQPADMDALNAIAARHGLIVIADGAHAIGAEYKGRPVGALAHMTTLSFHPVKHVATGEGGAILTNDEDLYRNLALFRTHGITRDPSLLEQSEGGWYYEQQALGYNYRMSDIQAALGESQLGKLPWSLKGRHAIVEIYNKAFADMPCITAPLQHPNSDSAWHLYVIQIDPARAGITRRDLYDALHARSIGVNVHYIPVYYHPYYRALGYERGLCPHAEALYERMLTLPLFPGMGDGDAERVIETVREVVRSQNSD